MPKTIIVSNRLPVRIETDNGEFRYKPSEGGLATGLGSIYQDGNNIWVGWPGMAVEESEQEAITRSLSEHSMRPVFLTNDLVDQYYLGFSNQTLWPAFHYFMQHIRFDPELWNAYQEANELFAQTIEKWLEPSDTLWVHDYQLMLVPYLLRQRHPDLAIGFFLHIPFPSYEVFRTLPWRKELLNGILGADYIGFHTYDDMRHFLSSCHRLAGYSYQRNEITVGNRIVEADSLPMGIDYEKYANNAGTYEVLEREKRYHESIGKQRIILSVDRLDYSKGIPNRLEAFREFLIRYPEYHEKVSLLLVVVPSRDRVPSYAELKDEVELLVGNINGKFGRIAWQPVHYFYRSLPLDALSAFYRMSDIAMITPMRDGMNLVAKEYIASRQFQRGVLILSEMAGAAKELSDALLVNPNDEEQLVQAIKSALEMPEPEQIRRISIMQKSLQKYTIFNWVELFFDSLERVKKRQHALSTRKITRQLEKKILAEYKKAKNKIIFLDYDGTLVGFHEDPEACAPDDELKEILDGLSSTPGTELVVISGRKGANLEAWLGEYPIDLIAEHGISVRKKGQDWTHNEAAQDLGWKEEAMEILQFYVDRTPGSFIEEKKYTLVWHYRKVEKGLGELRSGELASHLKHLLADKGLEVMEGDHIVEVKLSAINKGRAATERLGGFEGEFIMAFGDDRTDEDTFLALHDRAVTVKVGSGSSKAQYRLENHREVRSFLKKLIQK